MSIVLVGTNGRYEGWLFPIAGDLVTVGRENDNVLVIKDQGVSRHHAAIERVRETLYLRDLGSRNGTRINGVPLVGKKPVGLGDVVTFGEVSFAFEQHPDQPEPAGGKRQLVQTARLASRSPGDAFPRPDAPVDLKASPEHDRKLQRSDENRERLAVVLGEQVHASHPNRSSGLVIVLSVALALLACLALFLAAAVIATVFQVL